MIRPTIGISRCLLGDLVRFDGLSKGKPELIKRLQIYFSLTPICPEVEIGLSVPRPPVQLEQHGNQILAIGVIEREVDISILLRQLGENYRKSPLSGFILKGKSPSCGVISTPLHLADGSVTFGPGLFTRQLMKANPLPPIIEAEQLESEKENKIELEHFFQQVLEYIQKSKRIRSKK